MRLSPISSTRGPTRRGFLQRTFAAATGIAASSRQTLIRGESPNEQIQLGVIGTGVRGKYLIGNLPNSVRVCAVCDCSKSRMADTLAPKQEPFTEVLDRFRNTDARTCATYQDYRHMLDREKLDAVIIATPDHHHVLAAMLAMQADLDVYLEKPLTVTIREGRQLANMVASTGKILQVGSQQRTMEINRFACEFIRDGGLGKISRVELPGYPGPIRSPAFAAQPIPKDLDWDLFLGPAQSRSYHRRLWVKDEFKVGNLLWRGWDLFRDYSGHIMTNWGAHSVDMVQYALGKDDSGPIEIEAMEPDSVESLFQPWDIKTPAPTGSKDSRFWPVKMRYAEGTSVLFKGPNDPIRFYGERGTMRVRRNQFQADPPELVKDGPDPKVASQWNGKGHVARPHLQNWLNCIRSRETPNAPVEVGHRSVTVCHLANIARELGRALHWNPELEQFEDDDQANALTDRPRRPGFELPNSV